MKASSLSESSDLEFLDLLKRARKGEREALGELIDRCRPYLLKIAHDEGDSDLQAKFSESDIVQNACMDAVGGFARFRGRTSKEMHRWLRQILLARLNGERNHLQYRKRDGGTEYRLSDIDTPDHQDALAADDSTPSDVVVRKEENELLEKALQDLSELDRLIFDLRQKNGIAFADIAQELRMTESAAQKRWVRAIRMLQEKIGGHDGPAAQ